MYPVDSYTISLTSRVWYKTEKRVFLLRFFIYFKLEKGMVSQVKDLVEEIY